MKTKQFVIVLAWAGFVALENGSANETVIPTPPGSEFFGAYVTVLPNGNFVVVDHLYDDGATVNVGAVRLYTATGVLLSTLTGTTAEDRVGSGGIKVLTNGHYVVASPEWGDGTTNDLGAVTWCDGSTGLAGVVSAANSVVGSTSGDMAVTRITPLTNGRYVVAISYWDRAGIVNAGAVRLCSGTAATSGIFSSLNSLVGVQTEDQVGYNDCVALTNGNYVVISPLWDNGAVSDTGAITWGDGVLGVTGDVTASNSLVGSTASDQLGTSASEILERGVVALTNGNYVVRSKFWDRGSIVNAGAVTWCSGSTGRVGAVSELNSLVGSTLSDQVGLDFITPLTNGNYVVASSLWNNGALADAGAVTWGDGGSGIIGEVSALNSLVGGAAGDRVGEIYTLQAGQERVTALANGNYVVCSSSWDGGGPANAVGAVTWCDGSTGRVGLVSSANSLVGSVSNDQVGWGKAFALSNGHYVVSSPQCDNGAIGNAGAATWGNGFSGTTGVVSTANSLMGGSAGDQVSFNGITALTNGNYIVCSSRWKRATTAEAGAATWRDGSGPSGGTVSTSNSLIGSVTNDRISSGGALALTNGHYVVSSPQWNRGGVVDAGAVTWGNGAAGVTGFLSTSNSLAGASTGDIGGAIRAVSGGDYLVTGAPDNGALVNAGMVTLGIGTTGLTGFVSSVNSILGTIASASGNFHIGYEPASQTLIVGHPPANRLGLFKYRPDIAAYDGPGTAGERQSGGTAFDFGLVPPGSAPVEQTFTLKNLGRPAITGISLGLAAGGDAGFTLGAPGSTTLDTYVTTTFTVTFASAVSGTLNATVLVSSNDPDEAPFAIPLTVLSRTPLEVWREFWFGTYDNTGSAANTADDDFDGALNLLEYALDAAPTEATDFTQWLSTNIESDRLTYAFWHNTAATDLNWFVEVSTTLAAASWSTMVSKLGSAAWTSAPGFTVTQDGSTITVTDAVDASSTTARFVRLRVTLP